MASDATASRLVDRLAEDPVRGRRRRERQTNRWRSEQTTYVSTPGDHAAEESAADYPPADANMVWWYLDEVTLETRSTVHTVVTYGDSITDGYRSSQEPDRRRRASTTAPAPAALAPPQTDRTQPPAHR